MICSDHHHHFFPVSAVYFISRSARCLSSNRLRVLKYSTFLKFEFYKKENHQTPKKNKNKNKNYAKYI